MRAGSQDRREGEREGESRGKNHDTVLREGEVKREGRGGETFDGGCSCALVLLQVFWAVPSYTFHLAFFQKHMEKSCTTYFFLAIIRTK